MRIGQADRVALRKETPMNTITFNPFMAIAVNGRASHATTLARCFTSSSSILDVYACVRFARKCGLLSAGDYIAGEYFITFTDNDDCLTSDHWRALCVLAHEYLDGRDGVTLVGPPCPR